MQATARPAVLIDAVLPRIPAESRLARLAVDAALMFAFAGFVALCAQISVRLPWTTVPITGQTFAVLVTGGALGSWRGGGALLVYMLLGTLGASVFAPGNQVVAGSWDVHFIFPWNGTAADPWDISSGGYIVGFIFAAFWTGYFAERSWDRSPRGLLAMLGGNALLYIPGLLWLYYLIHTEWIPPGAGKPLGEFIAGSGDWDRTLKGGLYPFVVGDLMKLYLAFMVLPFAWTLVDKVKGRRSRERTPPGSPRR